MPSHGKTFGGSCLHSIWRRPSKGSTDRADDCVAMPDSQIPSFAGRKGRMTMDVRISIVGTVLLAAFWTQPDTRTGFGAPAQGGRPAPGIAKRFDGKQE